MVKNKEDKFYKALEEIFLGTEIEGDSGYINLLKIKSNYYKIILKEFKEKIDSDELVSDVFREELFDQLYSFFYKYFSESGSVYFLKTANWQRVYEKVYSDNDDVTLFWKTHMLYYVKSDTLFKSLSIKQGNNEFFFDASSLENKQSNEKKEVIFTLKNKQGSVFNFEVGYSERGKKTDLPDIANKTNISDEELEKAFSSFKKQTSVDFFINKDAKKYLTEQLDIYLHQLLLDDKNYFEQKRLNQIKAIKTYAIYIVDFISQFENELVKVWNKPKFAIDSNYVITLDKLNSEILKKISKHDSLKNQIKEWKELGMDTSSLDLENLKDNQKYLPLDTKHFKDLEVDILSLFSDLDSELDGRIVHSDNYQLLNTFRNKYKEKIQAIYIDPPYNTDGSPIIYVNNYRDSSWLTLMENRLSISKELLKQDGLQITAIDDYELRYLTPLQDKIFGKENHISTVTVLCTAQGRGGKFVDPTTEYYVVHAKNKNNLEEVRIPKPVKLEKNLKNKLKNWLESEIITLESFEHIIELEQDRKEFTPFLRPGDNSWARKQDLPQNKPNNDRPYRFYPILYKEGSLSMVQEDEYLKIYDSDKKDFNYKFIEELEKKYIDKGYLVIFPLKKDGVWGVWQRMFERASKEIDTYIFEDNKIKTPKFNDEVFPTLWDDTKFLNTTYGVIHLGNMGFVDFETPKSFHTVKRFLTIDHFDESGIFMDYFGGSGTTAEAVIRQNSEDGGSRKYIICELGSHFNSVVLPRTKKVCYSDSWKNGKPQDGTGSSQFFKYFRLEQYEETLKRMQYNESTPATLFDSSNPFENYIFFADSKFSEVVNANKDNIDINFDNLFSNIDLAETISNLLGYEIKSITKNHVELSNNKKYPINQNNLSSEDKEMLIKLIKPLIWWGE